MDSVAVTVPLRQPTKKMKKRKELDALAPAHAVSRRTSGKRSSQELLTDSSDDRSEYWNVSTRTSGGLRKCRRGGRSTGRGCPGILRACTAFLACASVLATASLVWMFIDVRQQLTALRTELDQVIAGTEGVPEQLQKCHTLSKNLLKNQTSIFGQLAKLKLQINNFTIQLAGVQHGLHKVQEWFEAAPELAHFPADLKDLSNSVVSFGSQIRDLGATVDSLKETNARVQDRQAIIEQNITSIKHSVSELSNATQRPSLAATNETKIKTDQLSAAILHLANNFTHGNETLTKMIQWVSEDQKQDHKKLNTLLDTTQSINMKVLSLGRECAKISDQSAILVSVQKLTDQLNRMREKLRLLESSYNALKNSSSQFVATFPGLQGRQDPAKVGPDQPKVELDLPKVEQVPDDVTSERSPVSVGKADARKPSKPTRLSVN